MDDTDLQLLQSYERNNSQDSFATLLNRHLNLVFSAALRQVRLPQLAEEVSQSVFADLAQSATKLKPDTILTAWLYEVTRRTAIDVVRRESRRQLREKVAHELTTMNATADDWTEIESFLDEAMHALDATDRAAVLLRYFENKTLREVGETLGTTDDAAQKRVSRAVERLREFFTKRGVTIGASGLAIVVSANAVQAAPIGLAGTISTTAALTGTTLVASATAIKTIAMTTAQKTLITATIIAAGVAAPFVIQHRAQIKLREKNRILREQADQLLAKRSAEPDPSPRLPNDQFHELLKLRDEVGTLRQEKQKTAGQPSQSDAKQGAREFVPTEKLSDAGLAEPEAAVQTFFWALQNGNTERLKQVVDIEAFKKAMHEMMLKVDPDFKLGEGDNDDFWIKSFQATGLLQGFQILSQRSNSPDEVEMEVAITAKDGSKKTNPLRFHQLNDEWKLDALAAADPESGYFEKTVTEPDGTVNTNQFKVKIQETKETKLIPDTPK